MTTYIESMITRVVQGSLFTDDLITDGQFLAELRRHPRQVAQMLASRLRARHALHSYPVPVEEIAQREGAEINTDPHAYFDGSLRQSGSGYIIQINGSLPPCRSRFSIAHELGHLLIDRMSREWSPDRHSPIRPFKGKQTDGRGTEELFCSWFAAHLLIPESVTACFATWATTSIEQLAIEAKNLYICLDALIWHVLEQIRPKGGGVLRFRLISSTHARREDMSQSAFELAQAFFPQARKMNIDVGHALNSATPLHRALAPLVPRIKRQDMIAERLYQNMELALGSLSVTRSVLVKPIGQSVWVLVLPPELNVATLAASPVQAWLTPPLLQLALFESETSFEGRKQN
jgi:IrrE N-terminal-like domain